MFGTLTQGSLVHILDKTNGLKYKTGEVIGTNSPMFGGAFGTPSFSATGPLVTLKVKIDDEIKEYPEVPTNQSVVSYNNGAITISETLQGVQTELENICKRNRHIINNTDYYEKELKEGEATLKQISPQFAKDKERDDRIDGLATKVTNMEDKLDKILERITQSK